MGRLPGAARSAEQYRLPVVEHVGAVEDIDAVTGKMALHRQRADEDGVYMHVFSDVFEHPYVGMRGRGLLIHGIGIGGRTHCQHAALLLSAPPHRDVVAGEGEHPSRAVALGGRGGKLVYEVVVEGALHWRLARNTLLLLLGK